MVLFNDTLIHGRPRMAQVAHVLARLRRESFADLPIADPCRQLLAESNLVWRDRLLPPLVTLQVFVVQVLFGNVAIAALRQLTGIAFACSSYCDARARLPLQLLQSLLQRMVELARESAEAPKMIGRRVWVADGSSWSMSDTLELREHFGLPAGVTPGVGYPMAKIMGLMDLATGMFASLLGVPLFQHDMRSVIGLHPMLQKGDILLGDRAFCSFAHLALLNAAGVFGCFRLHQRRKTNKVRGVERWNKPTKAPAWMNPVQFAQLPKFIDVRIVRYTIAQTGYRTRQVTIATTLFDECEWSDREIAALYGKRWHIETCFAHLKTTMKMNVLRCQTVDGVMKELAMYLAVYNLVRLAILRAAARQGVNPDRVSFIDAMRWLAARMVGLEGVETLIVNPDRAGRSQLRVIRRRIKAYDLLVRPRREEEGKRAENTGGKR